MVLPSISTRFKITLYYTWVLLERWGITSEAPTSAVLLAKASKKTPGFCFAPLFYCSCLQWQTEISDAPVRFISALQNLLERSKTLKHNVGKLMEAGHYITDGAELQAKWGQGQKAARRSQRTVVSLDISDFTPPFSIPLCPGIPKCKGPNISKRLWQNMQERTPGTLS